MENDKGVSCEASYMYIVRILYAKLGWSWEDRENWESDTKECQVEMMTLD